MAGVERKDRAIKLVVGGNVGHVYELPAHLVSDLIARTTFMGFKVLQEDLQASPEVWGRRDSGNEQF
ncbi:hypothetical protein D7044_08195 [Micromonospora musae]|uniref:Uncharacterized protein n=1 Tax=Micromonospora musae TaxID=1894970 RepID=A0A3A9YD30_9ACTN|nr:hypothetical protein D7044_08195 [Micromonospora musae]